MSIKHPHYDVIIAWAEGKAIQVWCTVGHYWYDWAFDNVAPSFTHDGKYRVKPETIRYRTYLIRTISGVSHHHVACVSEASNKEDPRDEWAQFVRWLEDWQEVEI